MKTRADEVLERALAGEAPLWSGKPAVGTAIVGELAGIGVVGIVLGLLGLLVFGAFVALAPDAHPGEPRVDPVAVGGVIVFFVTLVALAPPLALDALTLRRTRYAVTRSGLILVDGIVLLRARRVPPPFEKLELEPNAGGTVLLGEVEQSALDRAGAGSSERLFTRLRGLGTEAPRAFAALESIQRAAT